MQEFRFLPADCAPLPKPVIFLYFPPACPEMQTRAVIYTRTRGRRNRLAATHQDTLFPLKAIFLTRSLPGLG